MCVAVETGALVLSEGSWRGVDHGRRGIVVERRRVGFVLGVSDEILVGLAGQDVPGGAVVAVVWS